MTAPRQVLDTNIEGIIANNVGREVELIDQQTLKLTTAIEELNARRVKLVAHAKIEGIIIDSEDRSNADSNA